VSAESLTKTHSFRLFLGDFCPLGYTDRYITFRATQGPD